MPTCHHRGDIGDVLQLQTNFTQEAACSTAHLDGQASQQCKIKHCAMGTDLELLSLKHLQTRHGDLEGLPVVILQQVFHPTADKIEAFGTAGLQRPDR